MRIVDDTLTGANARMLLSIDHLLLFREVGNNCSFVKRERQSWKKSNRLLFRVWVFDCWMMMSGADVRRRNMLFAVALTLCFGGYWAVRPIKMGVFVTLVGIEWEPHAKIGTLFVMLALISAYNKAIHLWSIRKVIDGS
jgi:hypothetical protein